VTDERGRQWRGLALTDVWRRRVDHQEGGYEGYEGYEPFFHINGVFVWSKSCYIAKPFIPFIPFIGQNPYQLGAQCVSFAIFDRRPKRPPYNRFATPRAAVTRRRGQAVGKAVRPGRLVRSTRLAEPPPNTADYQPRNVYVIRYWLGANHCGCQTSGTCVKWTTVVGTVDHLSLCGFCACFEPLPPASLASRPGPPKAD